MIWPWKKRLDIEPLPERSTDKEELRAVQDDAYERLVRMTEKHLQVQRVSGELKTRVLEQNHIREAIRYVIQEKA